MAYDEGGPRVQTVVQAMKVKEVQGGPDDKNKYYWIWCNACQTEHQFEVPRWKFDGNMDQPTFHPSMKVQWGRFKTKEGTMGYIKCCHFILRNGVMEYQSDCTHELKGQKVPLQDFPKGG